MYYSIKHDIIYKMYTTKYILPADQRSPSKYYFGAKRMTCCAVRIPYTNGLGVFYKFNE